MEIFTWQIEILKLVGVTIAFLISVTCYTAFAVWTSDSLKDLYHFAKGKRREGSSVKGNVKIVIKSIALICTSLIVANFCIDLVVAYLFSALGA